jgi:NADH-quinone oxidoreductase subunit F
MPEAVKIFTRNFGVPEALTLAGARARGAYQGLAKAITMDREAVRVEVENAQLRGRGGAGFSTGRKWAFVPKDADVVYLVVNADEGEPATFKDRPLMEQDPHLLIEGTAIAAYALRARTAYIYIRGEFFKARRIVDKALEECYQAGILGSKILGSGPPLNIYSHPGAGAYICGDETGLLSSLEGKRGWPKLKPPFPAIKGLFDKPTIVNNVETLMAVPSIITNGAKWFSDLGSPKNGGTKLYCISGHVKRPGLYEFPSGTTGTQLLEAAGGMRGKPLKALIPGGSSAPVMLPHELDVPFDFDAMGTTDKIRPVESRKGKVFELAPGRPLRSVLGSAGLVFIEEGTCMVRVAARSAHFYAHESCGQCTPCREGSGFVMRTCWRIEHGQGKPEDLDLLADNCVMQAGNTICALADATVWSSLGYLTKFRDEFERHIAEKRCPFPSSGGH